MVIGLLLSVFLIATLASYFADYIKKHQWLGYVGLIAILIIAIQFTLTPSFIKTIIFGQNHVTNSQD